MTRLCALIFCLIPVAPLAHVSERALVLLLPTEIYIRSGVISVALTVALLFLLPPRFFASVFSLKPLFSIPKIPLTQTISLLSTLLLFAAIYAGINGSRDPLSNPLPLLIWSIWWITVPVLSALFGNIWSVLNPWSGLLSFLPLRPPFQPPKTYLPAVFILLLFSLFVLADIAPDDPDRLAWITLGYWIFTALMLALFGPAWLKRGEPFSIFFAQMAKLSPFSLTQRQLSLSVPGTRLIKTPIPLSLAFLLIVALGAGSFDGLNETFWWLAQININPLEFPGRSAVALPNSFGLIGGILLLGLVFAGTIWIGLALTGTNDAFKELFPKLTLSLIPIALGYHIAHYLTSFMVGSQYALKAMSDPMGTGADILGLGQFYVTTSFFNIPETVETIWLTQAGAIVIGHILAVLIAHGIALDTLKSHKKATLSQLPVAAFMLAYTFFGLWILAQPTGA